MKVLSAPVSLVSVEEQNLWREASVEPEKVPDNYRTTAEWAKIWGKGSTVTTRHIKRLVGAGKMDVKFFKVQTKFAVRPIPFYAAK